MHDTDHEHHHSNVRLLAVEESDVHPYQWRWRPLFPWYVLLLCKSFGVVQLSELWTSMYSTN